MTRMDADAQPTLQAELRDVARSRIARGAMHVVAEKGLDVTVDDVALAAGVSRRTVFRHFATHGELLAAGVTGVFATYDSQLGDLEPPGSDPAAWLEQTAQSIHELNRRILGRAFWDIHVDRPGRLPEVRAALEDAREHRVRYGKQLASAAWLAWGGAGAVPPYLVDAFNLQLSPFATNAMASYTPQRAGQASARILTYVLDGCLADSGRGD